MIRIETVLGNRDDDVWAERLATATTDSLELDQWEAQRSRLRKTTVGGRELAISLDRTVQLRDGDILDWQPDSSVAVIVAIALRPVMVVGLEGLLESPPELIVRTCVELGHAIGNQHWPAVVKGTQVYVPLTVDEAVMGSVMKTHALPGITYEFVPGSEVIPYLYPHESRRLFGASAPEEHSHASESPIHDHAN